VLESSSSSHVQRRAALPKDRLLAPLALLALLALLAPALTGFPALPGLRP